MTTLGVDSIDYAVDDTTILTDVSLQVNEGEFVALVGPNGSGKSTTLRCAAGLLTPTAGRVTLGDEDITDLDRTAIARRLAVIGQSMPVNFDFSVREIVEMGRAPHKGLFDSQNDEDRQIVDNALEKVGMQSLAEREYGSLSGGEKQRVLIARCLAQQADLLLLDEPTNHLDVRYTLDFLDLIHDFDGSVLIAMHDLNLAAQYADRIVVLEDGRVQAEGTPGEVLTEERIETVFGREAQVDRDPDTDRPRITFEPGVDVD
jgi:iron complex transport system ATP-binding protein